MQVTISLKSVLVARKSVIFFKMPPPLEKFQLKMGLLTLIQIPCHHVLSNEIALNLKYCLGLKQIFNINLGIGIIKKLPFCSYFRHISLCFYSNFDWESSLDANFNFLFLDQLRTSRQTSRGILSFLRSIENITSNFNIMIKYIITNVGDNLIITNGKGLLH